MAYLQLSMERQKNISKVIKLWHSAAAYMFPGFCYLPSWLLTSIIVIVLTFFFFCLQSHQSSTTGQNVMEIEINGTLQLISQVICPRTWECELIKVFLLQNHV